jgi:hypothetical protein
LVSILEKEDAPDGAIFDAITKIFVLTARSAELSMDTVLEAVRELWVVSAEERPSADIH